MQRLEVPKRIFDEKFNKIDEISKSPVRSPSKLRDVQTVQTGVTEIKIECTDHKRPLKISQFFGTVDSDVFCVKFNDEDTMIADATTDGTIHVYSLKDGNLLRELTGSDSYAPTTCLKWRPHVFPCKSKEKGGVLLAGNVDGTITQWHAASGKLLSKISEGDNQILAIDYTVSGINFATGGQDLKVRIYDESSKVIKTVYSLGPYKMPGHSNRIFALRFIDDDPNILLSGGWDSCVYIWDLREKASVGSIPGPNISGEALDYKKGTVLTGSHREEDSLELWDLGTRKRLQEISWGNKEAEGVAYVYSCQFSKVTSEYIIAGCSGLNEVKIFDWEDKCKELCRVKGLQKGCYTTDFGHCSKKVAYSGGDGIVYVCTLG